MAQTHLNRWTTDPEYIQILNYFIEITKDAKSPINVYKSAVDFKKKSGSSQKVTCLEHRIRRMRTIIHSFEHIDTKTKVELLFALSAPVDAGFLKELKKNALVEVDNKKRITNYEANDGSLRLKKDQSLSERLKTTNFELKHCLRSSANRCSIPKDEEVKEMGNLMEFITDMCENVETPLDISLLTKDFNTKYELSRSLLCIQTRIASYCREIQKTGLLDTHSTVKQLFGLSETVDSNFLNKLRKDAVVEVDDQNRITKYKANDGRLTLNRDPSLSAKNSNDWVGRRKSKTTVEKQCNSGGDKENEKENDHPEDDGEFDSDEENDHSNKTEDHIEPSNGAVGFDIETPTRNRSEMSTDGNFDFDPPTGKSHGSEKIETREVVRKENDTGITGKAVVKTRKLETLPKNNISSSTSHSPKTPKRKTDASGGSSSSKRTKPPSGKSMNPGEINDNSSHDDPPRIELKPFRGLLGLPNETQKDADIEQIPKPRPQVMEAPIKKEYKEEAHTSLKMVLNAFKSLILSLDTPGLSELQMELDKKIMEPGRRIEISKKEVILAMELLIVKLANYGAPNSSDDSISLREILSMLRTIFLTLKFSGFEVILEMLKVNIEQLKVQDKKVPVSKAECVLRATLDMICS
ncbi:unnamed protein product [Caenorhabditis brenneri]